MAFGSRVVAAVSVRRGRRRSDLCSLKFILRGSQSLCHPEPRAPRLILPVRVPVCRREAEEGADRVLQHLVRRTGVGVKVRGGVELEVKP